MSDERITYMSKLEVVYSSIKVLRSFECHLNAEKIPMRIMQLFYLVLVILAPLMLVEAAPVSKVPPAPEGDVVPQKIHFSWPGITINWKG
ncbi:unnamed protein product [Cylicocyclus nassatus]|uniref:Uncharacterized protein n=1 Tax=Cylicocyclus nassatus TaxID=53992 RepID=A0AA36M8B0_CYLNA|nr:unnamed protein product [Cylicocyclus nassatus]